ncbi:hypothetical protein HDIA_3716 [Hartmannibacter diazotrophicus]|uniref:PepSY domain-containing protein n=1 Tax=Hartmannibacter diazotrophicus TaxID=1482074 RepID=A0A2C9DAE0_9HYPH|nr:PepSY domain-containing protein [Hartmannibacter diazotrophicus]SON57257.1 hypothetical protein HDIA_3716 [Hartmannibacter diazotrophicus]
MKTRYLIATAAIVLIASAGMVAAEQDCEVRIGDWQPRSAVVKMAEERGWTVQRIKTDDGCYEIRCTDQDGRRMAVKVDPGTLQVLAMDYRDGDDDHGRRGESYRGDDDHGRDGGRRGEHEDDDDDDDEGGMMVPQNGPVDPNAPVPDNGLFNGKTRPKVQVQ